MHNAALRVGRTQHANDSSPRDPLLEPVSGDVVEHADGERRSVLVRLREPDRVRFRRAGADVPANEAQLECECSIDAWRLWAVCAEVLHLAHKPAEPPARRIARKAELARLAAVSP